MQIYVVKEGDTLARIADIFSVDAEEVAYANQILFPYRLAVGQALPSCTRDPPIRPALPVRAHRQGLRAPEIFCVSW